MFQKSKGKSLTLFFVQYIFFNISDNFKVSAFEISRISCKYLYFIDDLAIQLNNFNKVLLN